MSQKRCLKDWRILPSFRAVSLVMQVEPSLKNLLHLEQSQLELLKAAGFMHPSDLAKQSPKGLIKELGQAKQFLDLEGEVPDESTATKWLESCSEVAQGVVFKKEAPSPINRDQPGPDEQEAEYLDRDDLRLLKVGPAVFPRANELDDSRSPIKPKRKLSDRNEVNQPKIDAKKVRHMEDYAKGGGHVAPLDRGEADVRTTPKEGTNKGRDEKSRLYIRGVLHSGGGKVWFGALNTLLFYTLFPLSICAVGGLFFLDEQTKWMQVYLLIVPGLLLISAFFFLMVSYRSKCCVCTQRLFVPKNCNKNKKAHRIWGLGYVIPVALHIVLFRWFRCTFCGTTVRVKE